MGVQASWISAGQIPLENFIAKQRVDAFERVSANQNCADCSVNFVVLETQP
jgi:hypothetical protein